METPWRPGLLVLCVLLGVRGDDGDFDLSDALDEPDPTLRPGGGGLYPKLPQDTPGGGLRPPPRPRPQPQPRPRPRPDHDGVPGGSSSHDTHGHSHGDPQGQGNPVAQIVSPIVSVLVLALLGAGASYCGPAVTRKCRRQGADPEVV